ncbi:MAG: signal peptidase II [Actinomycetota bacterium]|nr:signal peptidase II [Actinomycetota bacterium]
MNLLRKREAVSSFEILIGTGAIALALDQATKAVVVQTLDPDRPVRVIKGILYWTLQRNPGAAFGIFQRAPVLFTVLAISIAAGILFLSRRPHDRVTAVALGLVLGGALGNLADRLFRPPGPFRGRVIDFIDFRVWPTFNIADAAVVAGALLLALQSLRTKSP